MLLYYYYFFFCNGLRGDCLSSVDLQTLSAPFLLTVSFCFLFKEKEKKEKKTKTSRRLRQNMANNNKAHIQCRPLRSVS